jgi:hypothetical protein
MGLERCQRPLDASVFGAGTNTHKSKLVRGGYKFKEFFRTIKIDLLPFFGVMQCHYSR